MGRSIVVEESRALPVTVEDAFARTLPMPLTDICSQWYGLFPPIKEVREQSGDWDAPGQTRVIAMVGGSLREQLTSVDPPQSFAYTLSGITGPMAPLVSTIDGKWSFTPAGTGTNVTWQWTIHAKSDLAAPLLPVLGKMWKGYARVTLEKLSRQLVG